MWFLLYVGVNVLLNKSKYPFCDRTKQNDFSHRRRRQRKKRYDWLLIPKLKLLLPSCPVTGTPSTYVYSCRKYWNSCCGTYFGADDCIDIVRIRPCCRRNLTSFVGVEKEFRPPVESNMAMYVSMVTYRSRADFNFKVKFSFSEVWWFSNRIRRRNYYVLNVTDCPDVAYHVFLKMFSTCRNVRCVPTKVSSNVSRLENQAAASPSSYYELQYDQKLPVHILHLIALSPPITAVLSIRQATFERNRPNCLPKSSLLPVHYLPYNGNHVQLYCHGKRKGKRPHLNDKVCWEDDHDKSAWNYYQRFKH